jgi:hypothetical protein
MGPCVHRDMGAGECLPGSDRVQGTIPCNSEGGAGGSKAKLFQNGGGQAEEAAGVDAATRLVHAKQEAKIALKWSLVMFQLFLRQPPSGSTRVSTNPVWVSALPCGRTEIKSG